MTDAAAATDAAGAGAASGAAPAGARAYPHLWFDDQGRPWIDDTNVKVIEIVRDRRAYGSSADDMHAQYPHLSLAQLHAALAYYYDHQEAFDREIEQELVEIDALAASANADSPLVQRRRAAGRHS